jgi:Flp pilus assembly protein TadD/SAM-dependent methyltransferase
LEDPYKSLLARASRELQAGRHREAERHYREVLAGAPEQAEASHFLGVCLVQTGRAGEGLALLKQASAIAPKTALYRHNHGLMLAQCGFLAEAERELRTAIELAPGNAASQGYLGMALQRLGRLEEAASAYRRGLALAPEDPFLANNYGYCLMEQGELREARVWLERSLAAQPHNPVAQNNLGSALQALGDVQGAILRYRQAVRQDNRYASAWYNLGLALRAVGDDAGALEALGRAVETGADFMPAWQELAEQFSQVRFDAWNGSAAQLMTRALRHPEVDAGPMAEAAWSLLSLESGFARGLADLYGQSARGPRWFEGEALKTLAPPMLLALIEDNLVPAPGCERFLRALRRELLQARLSKPFSDAPLLLELLCALAQQCFLNEYAWPESVQETTALETLMAELTQAPSARDLALLASYRPLTGMADRRPGGDNGPAWDRLWRRQVDEPATERALREAIPSLAPICDEISQAVQAQYEQNPYPRWQRLPASLASPYPLQRALSSLFPHARIAVPETPEMLIAGCGTGYHAALAASRNPRARIQSIDLSRTSLAYAIRRCRELNITNVGFAQADILRLHESPLRFDAIECVGVLHHLRDPMQGWRILLALLKPHGVMKVALYSELGRPGVIAARKLIAEQGIAADAPGIREARQLVFSQPEGHPARLLIGSADFYCASGARDLILHVQEHRFTLPQLRACLDSLNLEFLGFELANAAVRQEYRKLFPSDTAFTGLENWASYEERYPHTFAGMYQFWVRRRD